MPNDPNPNAFFGRVQAWINSNPHRVDRHPHGFQFKVTGPGGGTWHADLRPGKPKELKNEVLADPTAEIEIGVDDFMGVVNGNMNPIRLFGRKRVNIPSIGQAVKLYRIFKEVRNLHIKPGGP